MLDILIVHSDPEVRALLREAAMAVASSLACEEAANSEEARRIASRELPGLAVVEAELPIPHGEQAAGGFPGVQLAASLGPGGRPLPALLVLAGDITKGLLRAVGRLGVPDVHRS